MKTPIIMRPMMQSVAAVARRKAGAGGPASTEAITANPSSSTRTDSFYVGFNFEVTTFNIFVVEIGRFRLSGNSGVHVAQIRNAAGTVLASVSIDASLGTVGQMQWISIGTPLELPAGAYYSVMIEEGGDTWHDYEDASLNYPLANISSAYDTDNSGVPSTTGSLGRFGSSNFKFTA